MAARAGGTCPCRCRASGRLQSAVGLAKNPLCHAEASLCRDVGDADPPWRQGWGQHCLSRRPFVRRPLKNSWHEHHVGVYAQQPNPQKPGPHVRTQHDAVGELVRLRGHDH